MASPIYFITGTTGFLGGEFLRFLLAQDKNAQCYCLIRAQNEQLAAQRLQQQGLLLDSERIIAVPGDMTLPQFGLSDIQYQELTQKVTHIVHAAAMVKFEKPKEVLAQINILGTQNLLAFAKDCAAANPSFCVLGYVSTAYVAGKREGIVSEQDFSDAYGFKNHYESTKFAAEALVHAAKATLPVMIFRPSIILGNSETGAVTRSNVIFPLMQAIQKYSLGWVPFNQECLLDLVPVDYVAKSIYFLLWDQQARGQVFHLSCGLGNEMNIRQQITIANQVYQLHLRIVPRFFWSLGKHLFALTPQGKYIVPRVEPYLLYMDTNPQFCQQYTQSILNKYDVKCDNINNLLRNTLLFMEQAFFR